MQNIFAIREVTGEHLISGLEKYYEDGLVAAMADVDRCLTKAYDTRLANGDPKAEFDKCRMSETHQFVLDCGATFTNELYKLTKLSFMPFATRGVEGRETSERRIKASCVRPEVKPAPLRRPPVTPQADVPAGTKTPEPAATGTPETTAAPPAEAPKP